MFGKSFIQQLVISKYRLLFRCLSSQEQKEEIHRLVHGWSSNDLKEHILTTAETLSFVDKRYLLKAFSSVGQVDFPEHRLYINTASDIELTARLKSCAKEPMTVEWLRSELKPGDILYDIGANVGVYSLIASYFLNGQGSVYAFEPNFLNFNQLYKNIILNDLKTEIIPLQICLCHQTELNYFYYQNLEEGGALHSFSRSVDYKADEFEPQLTSGMLGLSLDDLSQVKGTKLPNLIKLDVDGLEYDILLGADTVLACPSLRSLLIEINEDLSEEAQNIIDLLHQKGFVPKEKHKLFQGLYNYIFYRKTALHDTIPTLASEVTVASVRSSNWLG